MSRTKSASLDQSQLSIASVERDTGIAKETLRVWERRYGFPAPGRNAQDERFYSADDLERLRIVRRLIAAGHRPGKLLRMQLPDLIHLATDSPVLEGAEVLGALELLISNRVGEFESFLAAGLSRDGLKSFVLTTAPALTRAVGEAWSRGELLIHQEHVFSEIMTGLLRAAIATVASRTRRPQVLLTTFPSEPHAIGLLMAEAMFAISGCACISLGAQTPVPDIVLAASAHETDIVGLSFSNTLSANRVTRGLTDLRERLPASVEIWAGGSAEGLARFRTPGVKVLRDLERIPEAVSAWKEAVQSA